MPIDRGSQSYRKEKVLLRNYHSIAICGFRRNGRRIYKDLAMRGINVPYIIERNYEALNVLEKDLPTPIVGFDRKNDFYEQAEMIIIADEYPAGVTVECLNLADIEVPLVGAGEYEF